MSGYYHIPEHLFDLNKKSKTLHSGRTSFLLYLLNKIKTMKTEVQLINIAQFHPSDDEANKAMKELQKHYDPTYMFCADCDGLVVKENQCCLNKTLTNKTEPKKE